MLRGKVSLCLDTHIVSYLCVWLFLPMRRSWGEIQQIIPHLHCFHKVKNHLGFNNIMGGTGRLYTSC